MPFTLAINGFGRIGRLVLRAWIESGRDDIEIIAVNDLATPDDMAHMLRFDSVHGRLPTPIAVSAEGFTLKGKTVHTSAERDPNALPWRQRGIDIVLECTGLFTHRDKAQAHLAAGARRVLISAPAQNADYTTVYGVNHDGLEARHHIVSNASCTTNCLAPIAARLDALCGIERGFMTTIHAYTGDQRLVDSYHSDRRRARAAALSMIPSSTGAARAIGLVLPQLAGKLDGASIRVPTANVSVVDLTAVISRPTSVAAINDDLRNAADGALKDILGIAAPHTVSTDFNHDPRSSIVDLDETQLIDQSLVRVLSWYDNEWGFANRMLDTAALMGRLLD